jgi:hypothetical protein
MTQETFPLCPPRTVQWRDVDNGARSLWRTADCDHTRWHYLENPCNCSVRGNTGWRPTMAFFHESLGYVMACVRPEVGTWRRDGRGIAAHAAAFRAQVRESATIGASARGPQAPLYAGDLQSLQSLQSLWFRRWVIDKGYLP